MAPFHLAPRARESLQAIVRSSDDAHQVRRAQALLGLHEGHRVSATARQLGVNRRTIQRWVKRYRVQAGELVAARIQAYPHLGRPAKHRKLVQRMIEQVWRRDPRHYGFRALLWTVPMLRCLFHTRTGHWVSSNTVRRALHSLRYRYKRPRLVLALRHPAWRQAKGGLNTGFLGENGRCACSLTRSFSTKFHRCALCGCPSVSRHAFPSWVSITRGGF